MKNWNGAFGTSTPGNVLPSAPLRQRKVLHKSLPERSRRQQLNRCLSGVEGSAHPIPEHNVALYPLPPLPERSRRGRGTGTEWVCRALLCIMVLTSFAFALPEGIGDFDINKVREAVTVTDSTTAAVPSKAGQDEKLPLVVLRIMLYLGIVIALIMGIAWFFKRNGGQARSGSGAMDIIETMPLGQNRMLLMVRILDEIYLLSQTPSNISMVDKIGGQKALDIIASSKGGGSGMIHFKDAFNSFMGKIRKTS